jgi:3-methyladenine DNA glycosylase AlkD
LASKKALTESRLKEAMDWLEANRSDHDFANLARFGIAATNPLGVSIAKIQMLAKQLGRDHDLALALWTTNCYEARLLASFVDDPAKVTSAQMDRWTKDFDNWGICDTLCFHLYDRTPFAYDKVELWCIKQEEFVKRAGFALMASLAGHDKKAADQPFLRGLELVEQEATDPRNFVKKGINWALRRIATRNEDLKAASIATARRLAESKDAAARWVGKDALRQMKT